MGIAKRAVKITIKRLEKVLESIKGEKTIKLVEKEFKDGVYAILQQGLDN